MCNSCHCCRCNSCGNAFCRAIENLFSDVGSCSGCGCGCNNVRSGCGCNNVRSGCGCAEVSAFSSCGYGDFDAYYVRQYALGGTRSDCGCGHGRND